MEVPQKLKIKLPYNPAKEKEEKEKRKTRMDLLGCELVHQEIVN